MLAYEPNERFNTADILNHPWFNGDLPSYEEVFEELLKRKKINDSISK